MYSVVAAIGPFKNSTTAKLTFLGSPPLYHHLSIFFSYHFPPVSPAKK